MFLPLPPQMAPVTEIRREIAVGERLLLRFPSFSHECVVANDGRIRLASGERVVAVRRTLVELLTALPSLIAVQRVPAPNAGFPILPTRTTLMVADGTPLLDALKGLPALESLTIVSADDRVLTIERAGFATRRLQSGDALLFGRGRLASRASVVGGVARPGVYEITETSTLSEVLAMAGNLVPRAIAARIVIERERKPLGPFSLPGDAATSVRPGDVVRVPVGAVVAYVSVAGAVK
ncbi:hypothetical protein EON77_06690, partial [bacterium]